MILGTESYWTSKPNSTEQTFCTYVLQKSHFNLPEIPEETVFRTSLRLAYAS